ncbi:cactin [Blumeria hordei DH14]|uniref:Splicing factor Cactin n=1 Tax=Blumeria graminis f. sp. hordei (strain DH14) TaxID=546991 RepID=N1JLL4_BLUG1|nr:cactin [Blumeria hordei DH14]
MAPRHDINRVSKPSRQNLPSTNFSANRTSRNNQSIEDEQTRKWVLEEDNFVLKQAKKKSEIRVREGRAKAIDWLAVILRVIDPDRDLLDDDEEEFEHDAIDPQSVFEYLDDAQLAELDKDISSYLALEKNKTNLEYWKTMQIICNDWRQKINPVHEGRAIGSVALDVDKLLGSKTYDQLVDLEQKIRDKLRSDEAIDIDYWDHMLRSLLLWKAKAKLKNVYQSVLESRFIIVQKQRKEDAEKARTKLLMLLRSSMPIIERGKQANVQVLQTQHQPLFPYSKIYDPKSSSFPDNIVTQENSVDENAFIKKIIDERERILNMGHGTSHILSAERKLLPNNKASTARNNNLTSLKCSTTTTDDYSQTTTALYDREVARGIDEDEEIFTGEEAITTVAEPQWADKYRPRKPRYFNRVQMGYEWNKYNQTHYDHDNPPPKVVQGYKFNIFYPDLIEKAKAPTFKIIRENGRKRGMSFAPAGEEDTCLIRFIAGPPYEDIAFRIVDKEWDYSAKRDRGFRSSFDKGILQLHFQYKKVCL